MTKGPLCCGSRKGKQCRKLARPQFGGTCTAVHQEQAEQYAPAAANAYSQFIFGDEFDCDDGDVMNEAATLSHAVSLAITNAIKAKRQERLAETRSVIYGAQGATATALVATLGGDAVVGSKRTAAQAQMAQEQAQTRMKQSMEEWVFDDGGMNNSPPGGYSGAAMDVDGLYETGLDE